tara:strand:- start:61 stop:378 length:318 start_codon:yes stop_codon:yes gene_type:complete
MVESNIEVAMKNVEMMRGLLFGLLLGAMGVGLGCGLALDPGTGLAIAGSGGARAVLYLEGSTYFKHLSEGKGLSCPDRFSQDTCCPPGFEHVGWKRQEFICLEKP